MERGRGQLPIAPADLARAVLVMFLWALCYPLIAAGLAGAPPLTFAALRSFVAGAGLLLPAFLSRRPVPQNWRVWLGVLGVGVSATSLGFGGMFLAGGLVSPGLATVLANAQPLIAAVLAYVVLQERLGPRRRMGLLLGLAGILLVALPGFVAGGNISLSGVGLGHVHIPLRLRKYRYLPYGTVSGAAVAAGQTCTDWRCTVVMLVLTKPDPIIKEDATWWKGRDAARA